MPEGATGVGHLTTDDAERIWAKIWGLKGQSGVLSWKRTRAALPVQLEVDICAVQHEAPLEGLRCIYQQELQKAMGQWTTCTDQGFQVDRRRFFGKPSFYLASKFLSNTKETLMRLEEKSFVLRVA